MKLSLVIPCHPDHGNQLTDLLRSINKQDFPKDEMEILVITEGNSESAKAIGIRQAKGEVIGILASDNVLIDNDFLSEAYSQTLRNGAYQPEWYHYTPEDDVLNRYFSLIGCNDPLAFYMGKSDRLPYHFSIHTYDPYSWKNTTIGDNGYFVKREAILKTDLDNYYHIDNAVEAGFCPFASGTYIWHRTGGNIFKFFAKRYRYGLQHAFNPNRRWNLVDLSRTRDIIRLIYFILCSITLIQPFMLSIKGYSKVRDVAWFMHVPVCLLTVVVYSILVIHIGARKIWRMLEQKLIVKQCLS